LAIWKFIQFIAERGHIKENRVKENHIGKSDGKEISNISGGSTYVQNIIHDTLGTN
jgi:hypothetical protein